MCGGSLAETIARMEGDADVRALMVDGVQTVWVPSTGPLTATLSFRTGRADESLVTAGVNHLVEHLALYPVGRGNPAPRFNGSVDAVATTFFVQGDEGDVVDFIRQVCVRLHDLPLDRLDVERGILMSEEDQRSASAVMSSLLRWRYGSASFGLPTYPELGLHTVTGEDLVAWASDRFTAGNAILAFAGEPPAGLELPLPAGDRLPPPVASTALAQTPTWYPEPTKGSALLTTLPRSAAAVGLRHCLERVLVARLRYELGASYSPAAVYEPRDALTAHLWVVADAVADRSAEVRDIVVAALSDAAERLPDPDTVTTWHAQVVQQAGSPGSLENWVFSHAHDLLLGGEHTTYAALVAQSTRTEPDQIRAAAAEAAGNALYHLPDSLGDVPELTPAPTWSTATVAGRSFIPVGHNVGPAHAALVVGPEGVMRVFEGPARITVSFADATALLRFRSGRRVLFGRDGFVIEVEPNGWRHGASVTTLIDQYAPEAVVVAMPGGPVQPAEPVVHREPFRRWAVLALEAVGVAALIVGTILLEQGALLVGAWLVLVESRRELLKLRAERRRRGLLDSPWHEWRADRRDRRERLAVPSAGPHSAP
jgi:hypothetical protein